MQERQASRSNDDHSPFKDHERNLIIGQRSTEPARKLSDTENRAREDGEGGEDKTAEEGLEDFAVVERGVCGFPCHRVLVKTPGIFEGHGGEDEDGHDLEGETC